MHNTKNHSKIFTSDSILFYFVLIFVFLCPFIYIKGLYNFVTLPQSAFVQVFSILLLILVLLNHAVSKKNIRVNKHFLNTAVLCFFVWTLISSFYAHNYYEAFDQWFHWAACILLFFLLQQIIDSEHQVLKLLGVLYAAGLFTAIIGICQYLFNIDFIPQSVKPSATFANKNMAAQFIVLTFPLAIALLCWSRQKTAIWLAAISAGIMIVFLVYTQTRAAWVAVFFELILIIIVLLKYFFKDKTRVFWNTDKTFASLTGIFLIVLFVNIGPNGFNWQFSSIFNRIISVLDYLPDEPSDLPPITLSSETKDEGPVRLAIWKNTMEMIKEKPFAGYGLGNHKVYYPLFHSKIVKEKVFSETHQLSNVHNDFLQLLSETGVIGVIAALFIFLSFFKLIAKVFRTKNNSVFFAGMGIAIPVAGILINSCFSFPFEMPIPPLILMIYFAMALCLSQKTGAYVLKISDKRLAILMIILIPLFYYSVRYYDSDIKSDRYYLQIKNLEKKQKWKSVTALANKAYALNPNKKKILSYSGRGYIESGEYQKGIDALQKVIKAYPYHMNALLNIGVAHSGLKQYDKAMVYYEKTLKIKSDFSKPHINIAGIYMSRKQYDKAVDYFKKAAVNEPDNPMVLYNMAISQVHLKEYDQAAIALKKAVEIKPDWANAQLNLAILYYQYLNRQKESIPYFKKTLELNPKVQNKDQIEKIIKIFSNKD